MIKYARIMAGRYRVGKWGAAPGYIRCSTCNADMKYSFENKPTCNTCRDNMNKHNLDEIRVLGGQYFHSSGNWLLGQKDFFPILLKNAIENKSTVYSHSMTCFTEMDEYTEMFNFVNSKEGIHNITHAVHTGGVGDEYNQKTIHDTFISDEFVIHLVSATHRKYSSYECSLITTIKLESSAILASLVELFKSKLSEVPRVITKCNLNILKERNGELSLSEIGTFHKEIQIDNYSDNIVDEFKFLVDEIKSNDPIGRIVILRGEPGTGKTSFIRGVINQCEDACVFVMVPVNMVAVFSSSELLELLIGMKDDYPTTKIVFIIEDADKILAPRQMDNSTIISVMLNFTDGLYNSLFDIRVIATTNEEITEFDPAIVRPGRLSKIIQFELHSYEKANEIFQRETKQTEINLDGDVHKKWHLGEVYQQAKVFNTGIEIPNADVPIKKPRNVGFSQNFLETIR